MKYCRMIQLWFTNAGHTDSHSTTIKLSKLEVLKAMREQGEIPAEVIFDLRCFGESHFTDPESGERTSIHIFEFDTDIEGQPQ